MQILANPVLLDEEGRKLSKSTGSAGVRSMRQRGMSPAEVYLAASRAAHELVVLGYSNQIGAVTAE